MLDYAAEQARAIVRLGALAELVEDEKRARREVAEREAAHDVRALVMRITPLLPRSCQAARRLDWARSRKTGSDTRDLLQVDHEGRRTLHVQLMSAAFWARMCEQYRTLVMDSFVEILVRMRSVKPMSASSTGTKQPARESSQSA